MTNESNESAQPTNRRALRDLALVIVLSVAVFLVAGIIELNEKVLEWTRPFEAWQIDEVPEMLLAFAIGMGWFAMRRRTEVRSEMALRLDAQNRTDELLNQNQALTQRLLMLQDEERRSIARDLHDELGQSLTAIKVEAVSIRDISGLQQSDIHAGAQRIAQIAEHVYGVVRSMLQRLRPSTLDSLGLATTLRELIDVWQQRHDTSASLMVEGELDDMPEAININLYRIVQEALTNIAKHAQARGVRVDIRKYATTPTPGQTKHWMRLIIDDDGLGIHNRSNSMGVGVLGMKERTRSLGGQFDIESRSPKGTRISITIPLHSTNA
jgi:two-component system, NarL family, sensor histidine kinase UhpB